MNYFAVRKAFLNDIIKKYRRQYKIDLKKWLPNPYYILKYKYICEISSFFSYLILKTNITPNFITLFNLFLGVVAFIIFAGDIHQLKILGLIIFFSKQILDNVDGIIARKKKITSKFGAHLDEICGHVYYFSIFFSLTFHSYYLSNNNQNILFIGFVALMLDLINSNFSKKLKKIKKNYINYFLIKFYLFLKIINFDGRTIKTDLIILTILVELFYNLNYFSYLLLWIFITPKILRNLYRFLKIVAKWI